MKRIGIFSENYDHDSCGLRNLLMQKYNLVPCIFIPIVKTMEGDDLENVKKVKKLLQKEITRKRLDFIIVFRDLDSLPDDQDKIKQRQTWFETIKIHLADLLLLTIYEAEALILADIQSFNKMYGTSISFKANPLFKAHPKEFLKQQTFKSAKKYQESHLADIFTQLDIHLIYQNHFHTDYPCFQIFMNQLDEKLA
jgi:hypothetical protein